MSDGCTWSGILGWRHSWLETGDCAWCEAKKDDA